MFFVKSKVRGTTTPQTMTQSGSSDTGITGHSQGLGDSNVSKVIVPSQWRKGISELRRKSMLRVAKVAARAPTQLVLTL